MPGFKTLVAVLTLCVSAQAFAPMTPVKSMSQAAAAPVALRRVPNQRSALQMGNNAKFGIFSPAVVAARAVLGDKTLNKLRGKGISLHSQAITEWTVYVGASSYQRGMLIKKAKNNGDELGFLV
uniref:Uncharacterized protein n=1 Tax=Florenciella parvula TaxID=236787 RepID=A0A7S2CST4_9STRA|eukprot:CAMPEP_0182530816 /NCGR_PEP_ID=MMETSP1323-20130603/6822_1 /TAXON_ID=236787 /ORGANISM="Florenciella parvula, Strain RCC1693" /LENGTH=123 /DNA_ID=CAMNT_0024740185 /DNA_START=29 /DNA_END=400 /DNA_ORIENTATION=-